MSDFGHYIHPVARKNHRCEWCGQVIPKGETHTAFNGMWQDEFQHWRMHNECFDDSSKNGYMEDGFTPYDHERPVKVMR